MYLQRFLQSANPKTIHMKRPYCSKSASALLLLGIFMAAIPFAAYSQSSTHSCGSANIHNPAITYGQVRDIDGNVYKTVVIGEQVWFAENLKVTRFQNGDAIPNVSDATAWAQLSGPGMCSYRNDPSFDCPQGKLYNFFTASDTRNPCPRGWRVPSMTDLYNLIFFLDPNANPQQPGNMPNIAGAAMKSAGLSFWRSPNTSAMNSAGFSAIPNGGRNNLGTFSFSNDAAASYWLSTQLGPGMGFFLELAFSQGQAVRNAFFSRYGVCIRCVTDKSTFNNNNTAFVIYPNPNPGEFKVRLPADFSAGSYAVALYDSKGARVFAQTAAFINQETSLNLRHLSAGMYYITVVDNLGKTVKSGKVSILR